MLPHYHQYPNLSEGADRGDKERPFSGVTKSGRVWRKVSESDARSVVGCVRAFEGWMARVDVGGKRVYGYIL